MQAVKTIFEKAMLIKTDSKSSCRGLMQNLYKEDDANAPFLSERGKKCLT